jgi:uncharacterized protein YuzB (UPF0349 family)
MKSYVATGVETAVSRLEADRGVDVVGINVAGSERCHRFAALFAFNPPEAVLADVAPHFVRDHTVVPQEL